MLSLRSGFPTKAVGFSGEVPRALEGSPGYRRAVESEWSLLGAGRK